MTLELSAEEIVTNLLSSNEVIKQNKNISYQDMNLGKYSMRFKEMTELTSPLEEITNEEPSDYPKSSKYSFIRGRWLV